MAGKYEMALKDVYKSLELDSNEPIPYTTLAEIHGELNNIDEFYINLEVALRINAKKVEKYSLSKEKVYTKFKNELRFQNLLEKYNIVIPILNG